MRPCGSFVSGTFFGNISSSTSRSIVLLDSEVISQVSFMLKKPRGSRAINRLLSGTRRRERFPPAIRRSSLRFATSVGLRYACHGEPIPVPRFYRPEFRPRQSRTEPSPAIRHRRKQFFPVRYGLSRATAGLSFSGQGIGSTRSGRESTRPCTPENQRAAVAADKTKAARSALYAIPAVVRLQRVGLHFPARQKRITASVRTIRPAGRFRPSGKGRCFRGTDAVRRKRVVSSRRHGKSGRCVGWRSSEELSVLHGGRFGHCCSPS